MKLICLGSGSTGNGYILETEKEAIMIECGISMREIKKALKWDISKIVGCLVSHHHQDHAKYLPEVIKCGIKVLALPEVFSIRLWGKSGRETKPFCKEIEPMHGYKVGGFKVFTFPLNHANNDGSECPCLGFLIEHEEMGKLLFVTDTMMLKYSFPVIDHVMIEANYEDNILAGNIESGIVESSQRSRLLASHLELQQSAKILQRPEFGAVQNIILLHLSSRNSDPEKFRKVITSATGIPTQVAKAGFEMDLSKTPY